MDKLQKDGYSKFMKQYFKENKELFSNLSKSQKPETMILTCSDSRIDPALLLDAHPGELFIIRNIGNIAPPYFPAKGSTQASIEYAVNVLHIKRIVILGHSNCGACAYMYHKAKEGETKLDHVDQWLNYITPAKGASMLEVHANKNKNIFELTEKHNIIVSLQRLMEYPYIQDNLIHDNIELEGWWYDIGSGAVEIYNFNTRHFDAVIQ
ncbi:MAG: Carbonic anhydrase (EC [uncultured Sulfurovum sp.]|uniref:Carbonic anhydrase n=1 Tax=uncultured Sulfurovum sp. TaxID=269237 RepID=A0A6S6TGQ8_9BACT|nr:MAG: Carbonic anhydrase (EC [uncultured Sulfurovum sp.]